MPGYLLPLTHILRRVCPLGAWSGQASGMAVGISEHSVTQQKKDNSRCVGSALWQRSGSDDTPDMCKHTASLFTAVSCTRFRMNSWRAQWVDVVGNLCWAPRPLSELRITQWNYCSLTKFIGGIHTQPPWHIILLEKLRDPMKDLILKINQCVCVCVYLLPC